MGFGIGEILLVLVLVILFFGAKRIPQIAKGVGEGIRNFRSSVRENGELGKPGEKEDSEARRLPPDRDA